MPSATPPSGKRKISYCRGVEPSSGVKVMVSVPGPGTLMSVARYWSPKAWRPITIGSVQPGTRRGTFLQMIGSRNTVPPRMLRMVPFGERHICLRPNSCTRASSGVIVAHLTPTLCCLIASAASTVMRSSVASRFWIERSKYRVSRSRCGKISLSLIMCQMIRAISSPSISTIGRFTLIFAMPASLPARAPFVADRTRLGQDSGPLPVPVRQARSAA